MNAATEGDKAGAASDWAEAIKQYTNALIELPRAPGYWIKRSTAYSRRRSDGGPDFHAALRDAELALALARERAKRELIIEAQLRRAIVFFQLEQYGNSGYLFDILAEKLGLGKQKHEDKSAQIQDAMTQKGSQRQENELSIWKIKVQGKINKLETGDQKLAVTISEYPDIKIPSEQELRKSIKAQLTASTTSGIVEELPDSTPTTEKTKETKLDVAGPGSSAPFTAGPGAPPATTPAASAVAKVRHEWYQSHDSVVVTVYAKGVKKDQLETELQEDSLSLEFPVSTGSTFSFNLEPLYAPIDPAQSKVNVVSTKIEVVLRKQVPGQKWGSLEGSASATSKPVVSAPMTQIPQASSGPSYPTSSKHGVKNWDRLATDLTKKKDKKKDEKEKKSASKDKDGADQEAGSDSDVDSDYGGGDAVDSFFKKLYASADSDTQRAMMKSYYESQGTALSTNWDEVGKDKVAVHPPSSD